jgi:hypothetical protein
VHPLQILNRPYTVPATGEERPADVHELGRMRIGSGYPDDEDFDAHTLVAAEGDVVELRLPWALLGFAEPSSLTLYDEQPEGRRARSKPGGSASRFRRATRRPLDERWPGVTWHERHETGLDDPAETMRAPGAGSRQLTGRRTASPSRLLD